MILRCPICQDDFSPRNSRARCCSKLCGSQLYYIENKERLIQYAKQYAKEHPDMVRQAKRDQYWRNREKLIQVQRDYRKRKAAERATVSHS